MTPPHAMSLQPRAISLLLLGQAMRGEAGLLHDTTFGNWSQVAWAEEQRGVFLGSPSIARAPDGKSLLASHDFFVQPAVAGWDRQNDNVSVYQSVDNGVEWRRVAGPLAGTYWAQLFVHQNHVYLIGVHRGLSVVIRDGGKTGLSWGDAVPIFNGSSYGSRIFDTAPSPVVEHGGRLWHSCTLGGLHGLISAPATGANLMDPKSWSLSGLSLPATDLPVPDSWNWPRENSGRRGDVSTAKYGEGVVVSGPGGEPLRLLSRLSFASPQWPAACQPGDGHVGSSCSLCTMKCPPRPAPPAVNKAVWFVFKQYGSAGCLSPGGCLVFERLADMPGGQCKMALLYDNTAGGYWSLGNNITTPQVDTGVHWWFARNNLTLSFSHNVSEDSWQVVDRILYDDTGLPHEQSLIFTGFHYADMIFDGADLLCLVRTAYRGAVNMHDSNRITMKRVSNFRSFISQ